MLINIVSTNICEYYLEEKKMVESKVYTLTEFCQAYHISKVFFHRLWSANLTPPVIRLSRKKILIDKESAKSWAKDMEERDHANRHSV